MNIRRNFLTILTACILILSMLLSACGNPNTDTNPSTDPDSSSSHPNESTGTKDPSEGSTTENTTPSGTEGSEDVDPSENTKPSEEETDPPATNPPATDPSETDPPVTNPPATNPPATDPSETNPPVTNPPATDHSHSYTSKVTAPTCTSGGYTTYTCSCGHSYTGNNTSAIGHSYKKETIAPTTSAKGYDLYTCSRCGDSYKDNYTDKLPSNSGGNTEITYTVTVVDSAGNPVKGMIVNCDGVLAGATNASGVATFKKPSGSYIITLNYPNGNIPQYDTSSAIVSSSNTSITITVIEKATANFELSAPSLKTGEYASHMAYTVTEGDNYATLVAGDMTYFIFTPTRSGFFKVSVQSSVSVDLGYYGGPMYVMFNKAMENNSDGSVTLEVHGYNIGSETTQTTMYVIGVKTANGESADCVMKITRTGDVPITPSDVAWTVADAEDKYMVKYDGEADKTLMNININSVKLSDITKGDDGYYYYKGKLLLIRIDSASEHLAAFTEICDTSTFGVYYYKENGEFDYKLRFNEMIAEYAEICDSNGVCPLNDQLMNMVKDVGDFKYWWDQDANMGYLFGDTPVNQETAWLFACCYYA